jgi:hypothetical protein
MTIPPNLSRILMGIWFIVTGAAVLVHLTFEAFPIIMAILAVLIGILLLIGK